MYHNYTSMIIQGGVFKTDHLNNSLVFNNRRKSAKQRLLGFGGHLMFIFIKPFRIQILIIILHMFCLTLQNDPIGVETPFVVTLFLFLFVFNILFCLLYFVFLWLVVLINIILFIFFSYSLLYILILYI